MKQLILIALLTCVVIAAPALAQTNNKTEQDVLKVVDDVLQALVKRDAAVIERWMTEDSYTVYDQGRVGDRKLLIDSFKSTTNGWDAWERGPAKVKLAGDAAFVLCETKAKGHNPSGSFDRHWQTTTVLVKERGQWRIAGSQFTLVRPPAPPATK